jgi:O-antigen ligase
LDGISVLIDSALLKRTTGTLLAAYLLALPVSHAFDIHAWLPWPFLILLVSLPFSLWFIARERQYQNTLHVWDLWIIALLVWLYVMTVADIIYRGGAPQEKELPHLLSYFGVIAVYYFGTKFLIFAGGMSAERINKFAAISFVIVILFACFEFVGKTYLGIDVDSYVPRVFDDEYNPLQGGILIRARGFASESGNFAMYLEVLMPIVAGHYWMVRRTGLAALMIAIGVIGLLLTFSAAAFVALPCALFTTFILRWAIRTRVPGEVKRSRGFGVLLVAVPIVIAVALSSQFDFEVFRSLYEKVTFVEEGSARDRLGRWEEAIERIRENPLIGTGAGGFLEGGVLRFGVVNWWLQILLESGLVGFLLLAGFICHVFFVAVRKHLNPGFAVGILAASLHYVVISDYWLPWLWFALACTMTVQDRRPPANLARLPHSNGTVQRISRA